MTGSDDCRVGTLGLQFFKVRPCAAVRVAVTSPRVQRRLSCGSISRWMALFVFAYSATARADDVLHLGMAVVDRPTLITLGVQLPVTGDDNHNATVGVRYRVSGAPDWKTALPLFRVRPEVVTGWTVPEQFAGSIFELAPATAYEIELHAVDADGPVDEVVTVSATTRGVPADPAQPNPKSISDAPSLAAALAAAQPGDVITIADGNYAGPFSMDASGTAENPIVIRGVSEEGVVLDGGGCSPCNVLEVYGSFVHVERLSIAHASRAMRFQTPGAEGNVVRYVHISDTTLGIGSQADQKDFYLCDNLLEGRLSWPSVYTDDGGAHANDDGIHVEGAGHVVCHNQIVGYGDAMKTEQDGARAVDFYGNEVLSAYDNGVELDGSEGNVRCFRNRFTNTYATISFQPIFGGPAYALRNVVVNVVNEQMKFHALGTTTPEEPSGILVYHNTFVSPTKALNLQTSATSHHFVIENNLFISNDSATRTVDWTGPIDDGRFDYDGYYPDGIFDFALPTGYQVMNSFAEVQAASVEPHGVLLGTPIFADGLVAPSDYTTSLTAADVTLASNSDAIDRGVVLANVNDGFSGTGPDLGALELGCPSPLFGVRPDGVTEVDEPTGCTTASADAGVVVDASSSGGAGGQMTTGGSSGGGPVASAGASGAGGSTGNDAAGASGGQDAGAANTDGQSKEDSGCGCRSAHGRTSSWSSIIGAIIAAFASRRRALHRSARSPRCSD